MLPDRHFTYSGRFTDKPWSPSNFGGASGEMMTLRRALATSNNVVTARVITELVTPPQVAFYARRMGIQSPLQPVASLALGTSDVTLLEITAAYCTIAGGGRYFEPSFVSRIEDRRGNVLYERSPSPAREAISPETAYTVVDMLRDAVRYGTATRLLGAPFRLGEYDLAGKTGTTQNSADGWFILMHPELVTGTWVGFNDRRVSFRSRYWGQGSHNALLIAGTFFRQAVDYPDLLIGRVPFPGPSDYALDESTRRVKR
jgi:penicillin-binding protein 1A